VRALRDTGWPLTRQPARCLWRKREHDYGRPPVTSEQDTGS
jgi:hypothetical protein